MTIASYRQPGEVADYTAAADIANGAVVPIGKMQCGIALASIATGFTGSAGLEGVYERAKNGAAFAQGAHVWWDPLALQCIAAPTTGAYFIGYAFEAAGASSATLFVLLEEFDAEPPRVLTLAATGNQSIAVADLLGGDLTVLVPNTAALTLSLPAVAYIPTGARLRVVKTSAAAYAVTLDPNASETIGGAATYASIDANGDWAEFQNTGSAWQLIASAIAA